MMYKYQVRFQKVCRRVVWTGMEDPNESIYHKRLAPFIHHQ